MTDYQNRAIDAAANGIDSALSVYLCLTDYGYAESMLGGDVHPMVVAALIDKVSKSHRVVQRYSSMKDLSPDMSESFKVAYASAEIDRAAEEVIVASLPIQHYTVTCGKEKALVVTTARFNTGIVTLIAGGVYESMWVDRAGAIKFVADVNANSL